MILHDIGRFICLALKDMKENTEGLPCKGSFIMKEALKPENVANRDFCVFALDISILNREKPLHGLLADILDSALVICDLELGENEEGEVDYADNFKLIPFSAITLIEYSEY